MINQQNCLDVVFAIAKGEVLKHQTDSYLCQPCKKRKMVAQYAWSFSVTQIIFLEQYNTIGIVYYEGVYYLEPKTHEARA